MQRDSLRLCPRGGHLSNGQTDLLIPHHVGHRNRLNYDEYYLTTATGYTNDEVFPMMMAQFEKDFHRRYPGLRAVVYMDRLSSHTKGDVLASMSKKEVILVLFPAGTTQFLQPLDNAVFAGFKAKLRLYRTKIWPPIHYVLQSLTTVCLLQ